MMGRLTRWGCEPRTGRRIAPVPLVRPLNTPPARRKKIFAAGMMTAASARPPSQGIGCEGRAPEGTSGSAANASGPPRMPVKRAHPAPVRPPSARIDLRTAHSAMDARAEAAAQRREAAAQAAVVDDGRVHCATCRMRVPPSFGQGCIAADCALRKSA